MASAQSSRSSNRCAHVVEDVSWTSRSLNPSVHVHGYVYVYVAVLYLFSGGVVERVIVVGGAGGRVETWNAVLAVREPYELRMELFTRRHDVPEDVEVFEQVRHAF